MTDISERSYTSNSNSLKVLHKLIKENELKIMNEHRLLFVDFSTYLTTAGIS